MVFPTEPVPKALSNYTYPRPLNRSQALLRKPCWPPRDRQECSSVKIFGAQTSCVMKNTRDIQGEVSGTVLPADPLQPLFCAPLRNHKEKKSNHFLVLEISALCSIRSFGHCLRNSSPLEMVGSITGGLEEYPCQNIFTSKMQNCLPTTPFFPQVQFLRQ